MTKAFHYLRWWVISRYLIIKGIDPHHRISAYFVAIQMRLAKGEPFKIEKLEPRSKLAEQQIVLNNPHLLPHKRFDQLLRQAIQDPKCFDLACHLLKAKHPKGSTIGPKDLVPMMRSTNKARRLLAISWATKLKPLYPE